MSSDSTRARRVAEWLGRHRWWLLAAALIVTLAAGWRTVLTYKALRSDLEELLPKSAPSVMALEQFRTRMSGVAYLGIVVDTGPSKDVEGANRFVDDLKRRIESYPPEMVGAVRSDVRAEREFLETYGAQLADPADIRELRKSVEELRDWEVSHALGIALDDEDEDPKPKIPVDALREKYEARLGKQAKRPGDRFVSVDGSTVVLLVQASNSSTSYEAYASLLARVRQDVEALGFPGAYGGGMRVGYAGEVPTRVEEMEGLAADLSVSGAIAASLVLLVIVWYFRSWWSLPVLGIPLVVGTLASFGLVALPPLSIRYLNNNTGFLGSVIVGNGINSGIMLLARYAEQRRAGGAVRTSVQTAVAETWKATLAAASAAACAYGSLVFTDFRGFNQFGYIGAVGMIACWASMYTLVPALLYVVGERYKVRAGRDDKMRVGGAWIAWCMRRPAWTIAVTAVLSAVCLAGLWKRGGNWIEQDFSRLRRRDSFVSGERYWGARMDRTLNTYLTPTIILASDEARADAIHDAVAALAREDKAGGLIASVRSTRDLLPPTRHQALEEIRLLRQTVTPRMKSTLSEENRKRVERALSDEALRPLEPEILPHVLTLGLKERDGSMGRTVLVFPRLTSGTWNSERIRAYGADLRAAASSDPKAVVTGSLPLSADLTSAMMTDGPRATVAGLIAACLICALAFGSLRLSSIAMLSVGIGVLLMMGALGWSGARLNFSNFVVLPITFGIASDYSINVLRRYQAEGSRADAASLASTGGAVGLCSATTIIGFGSLLAAQNGALFSFGLFAAIGEVTTLATATLVLPAALAAWGGWRARCKQPARLVS